MAYTYTPYEYEAGIGRPFYESNQGEWLTPDYRTSRQTGPEWDIEQTDRKRTQFQDYTGEQFKGLFDIVNAQANPLKGFAQTPTYSPYGGSRADFTTGGNKYHTGENWATSPTVFDQQGYLDAQFGNINNYLSGLSSFLGNVNDDASSQAVKQAEIQRAMQQANMPRVGSMQNYGGIPSSGMPTAGVPATGSSGGLGGFAQATPGSNYGGWGGRQVSGGWGSHPVAGGLLGFGGE